VGGWESEDAEALAASEQRWVVTIKRAPLRCARACGARKESLERSFTAMNGRSSTAFAVDFS
jgi:hypothetical protein